MNKQFLLLLFCCITSICSAQKHDPLPIPIPIEPGGNGPHSPSATTITLSAYYTSDTLTVEFVSYAGIAVISIIDEVTGTAVSQEIGHITATANTVQTDISTLPDGNYTLCIVLQTGDEYEGEFTIQRE